MLLLVLGWGRAPGHSLGWKLCWTPAFSGAAFCRAASSGLSQPPPPAPPAPASLHLSSACSAPLPGPDFVWGRLAGCPCARWRRQHPLRQTRLHGYMVPHVSSSPAPAWPLAPKGSEPRITRPGPALHILTPPTAYSEFPSKERARQAKIIPKPLLSTVRWASLKDATSLGILIPYNPER